MRTTKTLTTVNMGMTISPQDMKRLETDISNYRIRINDIKTKENIIVSGDISINYTYNCINLDLEYATEQGIFRYHPDIDQKKYKYTKDDVLKVIRIITLKPYNVLVQEERE